MRSKAIELNPKFANAYGIRGIAKYDSGDYEGALEDCEKTISINPALQSALQPTLDEAREKLEGK